MLDFKQKILDIHGNLGIPKEYETERSLILYFEESNLVDIEKDIFGRPQKLTPEAANSWSVMKRHAQNEDVVLRVVSAFRSIERQIEIIQKKLASGQHIAEILKTCAAPGYSEHHSGRAIDLTTIGCEEPLSETFDATEAFRWLEENAHYYSFKLSYPKGNKFGITYEPWHWAFSPK